MISLAQPPSVLIRLPLEGRPQVRCDYSSDGDQQRMEDWLDSRPEILALIGRALELEARAA